MFLHRALKMVSGEVFSTFRKSKTQRSYMKVFLFFLLLQMSLPCTVWGENNTTVSTSLTSVSDQSSVYTTPASAITNMYMTSGASSNPPNTSSNINTSTVPLVSTSMSTASSNGSLMGNDTTLSCPEFTCTTDCYAQVMNKTTNCPSNDYFCKLTKQGMSHSVNCSASCGTSCGNATHSNCTVDCCNTTNCLSSTLIAITNPPTTTATTKATTSTTTTKVTVAPTQANNGKKCHSFTCTGVACYKNVLSNSMMCPIGQDYCMLKKTTTGSEESWQGSCSTDCRKLQSCTASISPCYLECCNATSNSCLLLSGVLNMPSSASRGPHSSALLMASLLLIWIMRALTP
ncbi:keratin-associated protein 10-10-like [Xyrauchen texanus]|uniref:keratin-associated protein 10-10-like n=1 Tax=Xyrauchen texanus TaxID=154827 RepID=UPI0022419964|nr:keratin-associated protein 10-10-like [Xyrauchen texanus]